MKKYIIYTIGYLLFFTSCSSSSNQTSESEDPTASVDQIVITKNQFEASDFKLGEPASKTFERLTPVAGEVSSPIKAQATVSSLIDGRLENIRVKNGQSVKRGQYLLSLANPDLIDLQETFLKSKEEVQYLTSEVKRQENLIEDHIIPERELKMTQKDLNVAKATLASVGKKLNMYGMDIDKIQADQMQGVVNIYAPKSGVVYGLTINEGSYVGAQTELCHIIDGKELELQLSIPASRAYDVVVGDTIYFSTPNAKEDRQMAKVDRIIPVAGDGQMVQLIGVLDGGASHLRPGVFIQAEVTESMVEPFALPEESVVKTSSGSFVLELTGKNEDEYVFKKHAVKPQSIQNGWVALQDAEQLSGKTFLVKGAYMMVTE